MAIRVAVDAMGGDHAPDVVIKGVLQALQRASGQIEVLLVGPEERLRQELTSHPAAEALPLHVVHAPEVIGMDESPAAAVKAKRQSSIHVGLAAHREERADAFVSAGNTGAVMAASLFILGRLSGVARPSVIGFFPTTEGVCIVLDVGTNVDCKPEHLLQFARMGTLYARRVQQIESPSVALLNVGEEPGKGNEQVKEAYALLNEASDLHFIGNVEGRDVMHHAADVVVCDGFVGNVLLKFGESLVTAFMHMVRQEMQTQGLTAEQQQLVGGVLRGVQHRFNPEKYGGAPLLGVAGNVLIGHGSSTARAIAQMVLAAARLAEQDMAHSISAVVEA